MLALWFHLLASWYGKSKASQRKPCFGRSSSLGGLMVERLEDRLVPALYGITMNTNQLITIDTSTGLGTLVGSIGGTDIHLGMGFRGSNLYAYDQTLGALRQLNPTTAATITTVNVGIPITNIQEGDIAFRSDGMGFLASNYIANFFQFDVTVPNSNLIGNLGAFMDGLAFNSSDVLYGIDNGGKNLYTINTITGVATPVGSNALPGFSTTGGLAFDFSTGNLYGAFSFSLPGSPSLLYRIDPSNAAATLIGSIGFDCLTGLAFSPPPLVVLNQTGGSTDVTEGGATDSYTAVLTSAPSSNVTISIAGNAQVSVVPSSLVFTPANWNAPQTVTVTAVDDNIVELPDTGTITHTVNSGDALFNGTSVPSITANITDNDTAGVTLTHSSGATTVTEGGATDSYTVVLTSQPIASVVITVTPDTQVTAAPTTLTFTAANWNVPQTVTVTAVDDAVNEGAHTGTITHSAVSSDANYNGITIAGITANISDNDTPGVVVTESGGSTNIAEGGLTDSYTVVLSTAPSANVTITLTPDTQVTVGPASLIFTPTNWNTPRTVTVTAVDDTTVEGTHSGTITQVATSSDANYNGIAVAGVTANITDNDYPPGANFGGASPLLLEGGPSQTYQVVLDFQPISNVIITLHPDAQETVTPSTLIFTPLNWSVKQTVHVTAVNDILVEGSHTGIITHTISSADPAFNSLPPGIVTCVITDNDTLNGGNYADIIKVTPSSDKSLVLVTVNGKTSSVLSTLAQVTVQGLAANDTFTVDSPIIPVQADGGSGSDKLTVNGLAGTANTFVLTSTSLLVNGVAVTWANLESLTINGQSDQDTLTVQELPTFPVQFNGNDGRDILKGPDATSSWQINAIRGGILNARLKFINVENLNGGSANDAFIFSPGMAVTGLVDGGGGLNFLDYSLGLTPVTVNLQTGTATGTGGFANIGVLQGGKGSDRLIGPNQTNTWNISATNIGDLNGIFFQGIENLTGGTAYDTFLFTEGQGITGKIDGGGDSSATGDLLDYTAYTTPVAINVGTSKATGTAGFARITRGVAGSATANTLIAGPKSNLWTLTGTNAGTLSDGSTTFTFTGMNNLTGGFNSDTFSGTGAWTGKVDGGLGLDTIVGDDTDHAWAITGINAGTLDGRAFGGVENLRGGAGDDTFSFNAGKSIQGKVDGGGGSNVLDYSAFTTTVTVNLGLKKATGMGSFANLGQFLGGGSSTDSLIGPNVLTSWNLTGLNSGTISTSAGSTTFAGFENPTGGTSIDQFNLQTGGGWTGLLNGGLGTDYLFNLAGADWTTTTLGGYRFLGIEQKQG